LNGTNCRTVAASNALRKRPPAHGETAEGVTQTWYAEISPHFCDESKTVPSGERILPLLYGERSPPCGGCFEPNRRFWIGPMPQLPHVETIISHMGGSEILARIGVSELFSDDQRVSFKLTHTNPKGVRSVVISAQPRAFYAMECYGPVTPGSLTAPLLGTARQIIPENLATVLGKLTGIESIHHRHF